MLIDPHYATSTTLKVTLDPGLALALNNTPSAVTLTTTGETARLIFTGTAGQNLGLGLTGLTLSPSTSDDAKVYIYRPDGTEWVDTWCYTSNTTDGGCEYNLSNLPLTGTYTVVVVPERGATGSFTATLSTDVAAPLTAGTPYNLNLRPGQNARLTFSGTAGASLGIEVAGLTTTPAGETVYVQVLKPDGTSLHYISTSETGGFLNLANLPVTGTYTVWIDPYHATSTTLKVTLDPGLALALNNTPSAVTLTTTGETARLIFTGTAGQNLGLGLTGLTLTPSTSDYAHVYIYRPDGTGWEDKLCYPSDTADGGCEYDLSNLPLTGTYTVVVVPKNGATGSLPPHSPRMSPRP